ncbi:MAG: hypothetical protein ACREP8_14835, partial [Candidatus Binatia bacterium]
MPRGVAIRLLTFLVLTCIAVLYLVPNFVDPLPSWWAAVFPRERVRLGLDLQGGTHLILEVKVEKAIENSLERSAEELRNFFREKGIASVEAKRVENQILLRVPSESADKARELLRSDFSNLVVANSQVSAGRLELT